MQKIKTKSISYKWSAPGIIAVMITIFSINLPVFAGSYPEKPITMVVPYRAGGSTETMAQVFSKVLGEQLGQKVLVLTKPGAGGAVGATYVSKTRADGYTLLFSAINTLTWSPMTKPDIDYRVDSFRYVASITEYQQAFVAMPDSPFKTFAELISYSKTHPGLNVADQGGLSKAFIDYISKKEKTNWTAIPTKGGGEMIPFLLGGKVDFAYSGGVHNKYSKIHVLASCNSERLSSAPDAPSIKELYGISMPAAAVVSAPAGTPDTIVATLEKAIKKAMDDPAFTKILASLKFPKVFVGSHKTAVNAAEIVQGLKTVVADTK